MVMKITIVFFTDGSIYIKPRLEKSSVGCSRIHVISENTSFLRYFSVCLPVRFLSLT